MADERNNSHPQDVQSMGMQALTQGLEQASKEMGDSVGIDPNMYREGVSNSERFKSTYSSLDLGTDGKFFGIQVDPAFSGTLKILGMQLVPEIMDYCEKNAPQTMQSIAKNVLKKNPKEALEFGRSYGKALPWAILGAIPATQLAATAYNKVNKFNELRQALSVINKADGKLDLSGGFFSNPDNEVVHNARKKILESAKNDILSIVAFNAVALAPEVIRLRGNQAKQMEKSLSEAEFEYLKRHGTKEEIEEYTKERLRASLKTSAEGQSVLLEAKEEQKKEYMEGFKKFQDEKRSEARKAIRKANQDGNRKFFEDMGIKSPLDTTDFKSVFKPEPMKGKRQKSKYKQQTEIEDKWLKYEYGKQNGPWDESWISEARKKELRDSNGKIETRETLLNDMYRKEVDRINDFESGKTGKDGGPSDAGIKKSVNHAMQLVSSGIGGIFSGALTSKTNKDLRNKQALDMIINMRKALDENVQRDSIPGSMDSNKGEEYTYALYVHKIFQQNQRDSGLADIGDRYVSHLRASNWNDEAIQKMKDSELDTYEVAIKHISQYIRDGRMDALALVNLVGERKIVQRSGKTFGMMRGGNEGDVREALLKEIDKQAAVLKPQHKMEEQEISEALSHYSFTKEELQAAFSSQSRLDKDAKEFLFALIDMNMPDHEVVKDLTGLSDKQVKDMRAASQERFTREFDAALREIAADIEQNPENAPAKYNLSEEQIKHFMDLSRKAHETDATLDGLLTNGNRKQVAASVASIMIDDSEKHSGSFWRNKIKPHAHETKQRNEEEIAIKQEEKARAESQEFGTQEQHEESYASKFMDSAVDRSVQTAKDYSNGYLDSGVVVTEDMQKHFTDPALASQASKVAQSAASNYLGVGA